jgi:hypothetical protein
LGRPSWTIASARLLVGQHALQRGDLRGQLGDVLLRVIDDGEPLVELLQVVGRVLGRGLHRRAEMLGDGIEPLVHRALQLRLGLRQQFAHGLDPGAELDDALIGELRGGGLLGRKLCRSRVRDRRPRPVDEYGEAGDRQTDDKTESDEQNGFHGSQSYAIRVWANPIRTKREHIDPAKSSP